jgi:hypothetical protein
MSDKKCYTWNDATLSWLEANITWEEACVISKIIEEVRIKGVKPERHLKKMDKKDKQILINLITRIETEQNNEITINSSKIKNQKVKVTIKDMEIFIKEIANIKVNVII